jgi:hypothetical protein
MIYALIALTILIAGTLLLWVRIRRDGQNATPTRQGDDLQAQIYNWLGTHFPEGPEWNKAGFHCFESCPPLVRSMLAMDSVEAQIMNGAWGQLLWNTFPNWRTVLALAGQGYTMMGANAQVSAISMLAAKFAEHETACAAAIERAKTGDFNAEFGAFTTAGYADVNFKEQRLFLDPALKAMRTRWLNANRAVLHQALSA